MDGFGELVLGNEEKSLEQLENAIHVADGANLAGFGQRNQEQLAGGATYLSKPPRSTAVWAATFPTTASPPL
ncbi:MAG: hypothetical protein KatS3mg008_2151 [Acidimicrobiales bacterium]|nr:MAG: hypothetical protein KatS3mg008_2151 [Acidimicrobiales bacterium]